MLEIRLAGSCLRTARYRAERASLWKQMMTATVGRVDAYSCALHLHPSHRPHARRHQRQRQLEMDGPVRRRGVAAGQIEACAPSPQQSSAKRDRGAASGLPCADGAARPPATCAAPWRQARAGTRPTRWRRPLRCSAAVHAWMCEPSVLAAASTVSYAVRLRPCRQ